ncbi:hypothetical protein KORDIASMS9_00560 [Kordia sp. SMS9]|uniref:DUF547 domain-containing protein n=1 Tax=Kordia sp. SMS9 TaxID=2282170 RepID=UPI000E0E00F7|nr:DUF547 domain-containing protein [Kordia sp. SMS9]AXG68345.1 hypothetical protein KORDIASMS9_00560 [Kordia sp. SMS9]
MRQIISTIVITICFISCGTQQKSTKKTPETVFTILDSIQKKFDEIAEKDSINFKKNAKFVSSKSISKSNHTAWHNLLQKYVSDDGKVNYVGLKEDRQKVLMYIDQLGAQKPTKDWSRNETLAYWINAYNVMTVDLILDSYPARKGIKEIRNPWKQRRWTIEGRAYNLDEIEHDILRKMNEPRIHFAINCASFSCPPLLNEAFTANKMESQLTQVTKAFLADSKRNTITKNQLEISKIFKWFSKDFKQKGSLIDFLNLYSPIKINADANIDYKDYDWRLNE